MSVLKKLPSQHLHYTATRQKLLIFSTCWPQTSTQTSYSLCDHDPLHTRSPSQLNASTKPTDNSGYPSECVEAFQQMARNCTIPTSNLPPALFLYQSWRSRVYNVFNAECDMRCSSRASWPIYKQWYTPQLSHRQGVSPIHQHIHSSQSTKSQ